MPRKLCQIKVWLESNHINPSISSMLARWLNQTPLREPKKYNDNRSGKRHTFQLSPFNFISNITKWAKTSYFLTVLWHLYRQDPRVMINPAHSTFAAWKILPFCNKFIVLISQLKHVFSTLLRLITIYHLFPNTSKTENETCLHATKL